MSHVTAPREPRPTEILVRPATLATPGHRAAALVAVGLTATAALLPAAAAVHSAGTSPHTDPTSRWALGGVVLAVVAAAATASSGRRARRATAMTGLALAAVAVAVSLLTGATSVAAAHVVGGIGTGLALGALVGWLRARGPARPALPAVLVAAAAVAIAAGAALPPLGAGARTAAVVGGLLVGAALIAARLPGTVSTPRTPRMTLPLPAVPPARSSGELHRPGTRGYRRAAATFDIGAPLRPALAGTVTNVAQVREALATARRKGLRVRVHSTGHGAASATAMAHEVLLKVRIDEPVTVDAARRLVRVPAGAAWRAVVPQLVPHALAAAHGSSGHVGVVGYLTRGGLSAYARSTGVAANTLESVEIVLADGRLVVADREREPELFWAIRGGGGGYGVVTAVTVRTFEPGTLVTGTTFWPLSDAPAVSRAWEEWTHEAPATATTSLRVMSLPPLPGLPLRLAGRRWLVLDGTVVDRAPAAPAGAPAVEVAGELLARVRGAARPVLDTWRSAGPAEVPHTHMDPPVSLANSTDHMLLDGDGTAPRPAATGLVDAWLDQASAPGSGALTTVELRHLGGALAEAPADGGAVAALPGRFGYFAAGLHQPLRGAAAPRRALDRFRDALSGWDTGRTAPTFAPRPDLPQRSFDAATAARAAAVRVAVDPTGLFAGDVAPGALVTAPGRG